MQAPLSGVIRKTDSRGSLSLRVERHATGGSANYRAGASSSRFILGSGGDALEVTNHSGHVLLDILNLHVPFAQLFFYELLLPLQIIPHFDKCFDDSLYPLPESSTHDVLV
jgi:hypothetical protein